MLALCLSTRGVAPREVCAVGAMVSPLGTAEFTVSFSYP